jgi:hypothetical protein
MKTKTIRVYIPVNITIPEEHIEMVMSEEWQDSFYDFDSIKEFAMYVARLMLYNLLEEKIPGLLCLTGFDGHCVDEHKGHFSAVIPDEGWDLESVEDFAEDD